MPVLQTVPPRVRRRHVREPLPGPLTDLFGQIALPGFNTPLRLGGHNFPVPALDSNTKYDMPVAMELDTASDIATVLLDRKMLIPEDWTGKFIPSIERGLERWANDTMKTHLLEYIDVAVIFTDNIRTLHFDCDEWMEQSENHHHPDGYVDKYGAFALESNLIDLLEIKGKVKELEQIEKGAGIACARTLFRALQEFDVFTPEMCHYLVEQYEDNYDDQPEPGEPVVDNATGQIISAGHSEDDEDLYPRMERFEQELPEGITGGPYDQQAMFRCLEKVTEPGLKRLVEDCIALMQLDESAEAVAYELNACPTFSQTGYGYEAHVPPIAVMYEMYGIENRIFDDWDMMLVQGEHTLLCWMNAFDIGNLDAIHRGALALEWAIKLMVQCDQVLQGMNWDRTRDMRFHEGKRTKEEKRADATRRDEEGRYRPPRP